MREGIIVTFYSYKGGVGRTFAMANIAALLSTWGYKTLCIDWDLEAPGLHLYFEPWMQPDLLVSLFTTNKQSLDGSVKIVNRARLMRNNLPIDREKLLILPVASRFDGRREYEKGQEWLKTFAEKRIKDSDDIGFALETLAAIVAQKLSYSDILVNNRDLFVETAKRGPVAYEPVPIAQTSGSPISVFIGYSHKDEEFYKQLEVHLLGLRRQYDLLLWSQRMIPAGASWTSEVNLRLEEADIILLLISADYLASDFVYSIEMEQALKRQSKGETRVIPIILRPADWEDASFSKLQVLPSNTKPISLWQDRDAAFADITQELRKIIQGLRS